MSFSTGWMVKRKAKRNDGCHNQDNESDVLQGCPHQLQKVFFGFLGGITFAPNISILLCKSSGFPSKPAAGVTKTLQLLFTSILFSIQVCFYCVGSVFGIKHAACFILVTMGYVSISESNLCNLHTCPHFSIEGNPFISW